MGYMFGLHTSNPILRLLTHFSLPMSLQVPPSPPQTLNPKPQTPNPKPQTLNPITGMLSQVKELPALASTQLLVCTCDVDSKG